MKWRWLFRWALALVFSGGAWIVASGGGAGVARFQMPADEAISVIRQDCGGYSGPYGWLVNLSPEDQQYFAPLHGHPEFEAFSQELRRRHEAEKLARVPQ